MKLTHAEYVDIINRQVAIRADLVKELTLETQFTVDEIIKLVTYTLPLIIPPEPPHFD